MWQDHDGEPQPLQDGEDEDSGSHNESTEDWSPDLERRKAFWDKYKVPVSKHMQPAWCQGGRSVMQANRAEDAEEEALSEDDHEVEDEAVVAEHEHDAGDAEPESEDEAMASEHERDDGGDASEPSQDEAMVSEHERDDGGDASEPEVEDEPVVPEHEHGAGGDASEPADEDDEATASEAERGHGADEGNFADGAAAMEDFAKQLQDVMEASQEEKDRYEEKERYNPEGKADSLTPCGYVFGNERFCTGTGCLQCLKALQQGVKRAPTGFQMLGH